jgi:hypothetical protein
MLFICSKIGNKQRKTKKIRIKRPIIPFLLKKLINFAIRKINVDRFGQLATTVKNAKYS